MQRWILLGLGLGATGCAGDPKATDDAAPPGPDAGDDDDATGDDTTGDDDDTTGVDADGDGYTADVDCDDADDAVYPGAPDVCGDDRVTDCDRTSDDGLVTVDGAASFTDLQDALDAAPAGATVTVCPGTYTGTFAAPAPVSLVAHGGPDVTVLDGAQAGTTLRLPGDSELVGFTVTGGRQPTIYRGGGVDLASTGTLLVDGCVIADNAASTGGGLFVPAGATVTLRDSVVSGNRVEENADNIADFGCGLFAEPDVTLDLTGTTITDNDLCGAFVQSGAAIGGLLTENRGMGLAIGLPAGIDTRYDLTGTEVTANDGVGISVGGSSGFPDSVEFTDVTSSGNRGGGLSVSGTDLSLLGTTEIVDNTAFDGAGVVVRPGATLTGGVVARNVATGSGGGVLLSTYDYVPSTLRDVVIEDNVAENGAGVAFGTDWGVITIEGGRIAHNVATGRGGAVDLPGVGGGYYVARLTLVGVEITDNAADQGGGLALTSGAVTLERCTVARNAASVGGGAYLTGDVLLESAATDWGEGADANLPGDVYASGELVGYGAAATFSCTAAGCDPAP